MTTTASSAAPETPPTAIALDPALRDPERADWTLKDWYRAWVLHVVLAALFLTVEVVMITEMMTKIANNVLGSKADGMPIVVLAIAAICGLALAVVGYVLAMTAGEKSRLEMFQSKVALGAVALLGIGLAGVRVFHLMQNVKTTNTKGAGTAAAAQASSSNFASSVIMAGALLLLYVGLTVHAWHVGRHQRNPALVGMVRAEGKIAKLQRQVAKEAAMVEALRRDVGVTEHQIARLPEERATAMREVHAMIVAASHAARLRLAELLRLPEATSLTRTPIEFKPWPAGVQHTPPVPIYDRPAPGDPGDTSSVTTTPLPLTNSTVSPETPRPNGATPHTPVH